MARDGAGAAEGETHDARERDKDPSLSYRYWVGARGGGAEALAPPPQPRKLTPEEAASMARSSSQGSLWNQGGTWEERTLNQWAKDRLTELMRVSEAVHAQGNWFHVTTELDSLSGDTTIVVVRNKKKHGYMLDISLKFSGRGEADSAKVEGTMRMAEVTFGDIDGIHLEVTVETEKSTGIPESVKGSVEAQLSKQLLPQLQARLQEFENDLVQR